MRDRHAIRETARRRAAGVGPALGLLVAALALAACGPTGYTKANPVWGSRYGYTDKAAGVDEYSVVVTASPQTAGAQLADIALFRAANIAREHGRTHFVVVSKSAETLPARGMISVPVGGGVFLPVAETTSQEPHAILIIRLLPNEGPRPDDAIDAGSVIARLGPRLQSGS